MSQTFIGTVTRLKSFTEKVILGSQIEKNECSQCNGKFQEKVKQSEKAIWEIRGVEDKFFCSRKCVGDWLKSNENQEVRAKTVVAETFSTKLHPKYSKPIKKEKDYQVHNEECDLKLGDKVIIKSSRPYSKTKRFIVIKKEEGNKNIKRDKIIISDSIIKYENIKYKNYKYTTAKLKSHGKKK